MRRTILPAVFSTFLAGFLSSFTRPSAAHFKTYVAGLMLIEHLRCISRIAREFGGTGVDSLHYFLHDAAWDLREVIEQSQQAVLAVEARTRPLLILDDTAIERHGAMIEGTGPHHGARGLVWGQCVVTALVRVGGHNFLWDVRGYRPRRSCPAQEFVSKIDLALEILKEAAGRSSFVVVMDSWYACGRILNEIAGNEWKFVTSVRPNRLVRINGHKTRVANLAKGPHAYRKVRLDDRHVVEVIEREAYLPKFGVVKVVIGREGKSRRYMITNDLEMSGEDVVRTYAQRVWIDATHENIKQHLGFGQMHMRSWKAAQRHWALVLVAHNALVFWQRSRRGAFEGRSLRWTVEDLRTRYKRPRRRQLKAELKRMAG